MDHLFDRGGCTIIKKKNSAQQKMVGKNRASAIYFAGPVFELEKNIAQNIAHRKKNHVQPKGEKKIHAPESCPFSPPSKKIMVCP